MNYIYPKQCEELAAKIFEFAGCTVELKGGPRDPFDIIANDKENTYLIEVKSSNSIEYSNNDFLDKTIERIIKELNKFKFEKKDKSNHSVKAVLLVFALLGEKYKNGNCSRDDLIILDLGNLFYVTKDSFLYEKIISTLVFYVKDPQKIEKAPQNIELKCLSNELTSVADILNQLDNCRPGKRDSVLFEKNCVNLLKKIFKKDLTLWKEQVNSNNDLYRFDLICKIKNFIDGIYDCPTVNSNCFSNKSDYSENSSCFWTLLERHFNSKYVIFEFKNYSSFITQNELYITEKYLYDKALRNVAIIISRKGFNRNASIAARGILREHGKLIMDLTIEELRNSLEKSKFTPLELLVNKLDAMLIDLEK